MPRGHGAGVAAELEDAVAASGGGATAAVAAAEAAVEAVARQLVPQGLGVGGVAALAAIEVREAAAAVVGHHRVGVLTADAGADRLHSRPRSQRRAPSGTCRAQKPRAR